MSYIDLKSQIISKLDLIDEIQQVEEYPTTDVNGYPAAIVRSMSNDAEYETTCDNLETYRFIVYLLVENSEGFKGVKKARAIVEEVADVIIALSQTEEEKTQKRARLIMLKKRKNLLVVIVMMMSAMMTVIVI